MKKNLFDITDKIIVITGATGVLGGCVAEYLAEQGAKIILLGRRENEGQALEKRIVENGRTAKFFACDVLDEKSLQTVCDDVVKNFKTIDVLINAAGGNKPGATIMPNQSFLDINTDDFENVVKLNLSGTLIPTKIFSKPMIEKGEGNILNFSSVASLRPLTRICGYASAKASINNLTQFLATEIATKYGEKIRVNAIIPGFFLTEQNRTLLTNPDGSYTDRAKSIIRQTPFARFGMPDELCGCVHYLISDASKFVTGTVSIVDGGFSAFAI
ncbi:MAG: SDR family oxidoreductase [Bacteroidales bacterium]|jgi:NAD(P)-dependent dehydrogenase (short-subunit alcohol dehydrogenase family)|nr:SDR family oxidoreductase [Bacteroidales bacterium]